MDPLYVALIAVGVGIVCILVTSLIFVFVPKAKKEKAEKTAESIINDAIAKAEKLLADSKAEAKSDYEETMKKASAEAQTSKAESEKREAKLDQRETALDKREDAIITREDQLDQKRNEYEQKKSEYEERIAGVAEKEKELQEKTDSIIDELQKVANMSIDEARDELMARVEEKEMKKIALYKEQMEEQAESECEDHAKMLLANAMEKYAQDVTCERSTSTVALPTDEMKGRIIGREGRNIKSMEQLFGVSLIIDDTPETLTVSCFDPIRREKAKLTL